MDGWAKSRLRFIAAGCMVGAMGAPVALLFWYLNASNPSYPGVSPSSLVTIYMLPALASEQSLRQESTAQISTL